jgi:hypothetical protein
MVSADLKNLVNYGIIFAIINVVVGGRYGKYLVGV